MLHPVNAILLLEDALNLSRCLVYILYSQLGKNEIVHSTPMPYSPVKHNDTSKTMPSLWQGRLHLLYVVTDRDHVCVKKRQSFPTLLLRALQRCSDSNISRMCLVEAQANRPHTDIYT